MFFATVSKLFSRTENNCVIMVANCKSHGSLTVRYGAVIFGFGTLAHFFIELLSFFENKFDSPCRYSVIGANTILILIFIILQTCLIFMYPRLNLHLHQFWNK